LHTHQDANTCLPISGRENERDADVEEVSSKKMLYAQNGVSMMTKARHRVP